MIQAVLITALFALSGPAQADVASPPGLCEPTEISFFACQTTQQRWISLCGKPPVGLQYRFGKAGRLELLYPENAGDGMDRFLFAHYWRFQTDRIEIGFRNQGVEYAVFDYTDGRNHRAGVRITTRDGKESELRCFGRITGRLGELKTVLRCDADNALNGGICPQ